MGRNKKIKVINDKVDNSTDIVSSYIQGQKIKKILNDASYLNNKGESYVRLDNLSMGLDHACHKIDLLSRVNTSKAYDMVSNGGASKLNFKKLTSQSQS